MRKKIIMTNRIRDCQIKNSITLLLLNITFYTLEIALVRVML